ncbi:NmrA family NAD(P)-binding protein [Aestuariibacter sp. A3R04]|uniref:NmrA family NAD(P)-binding protein n=1 Tax=Aestuariibacter sp. A3R04 TaxID=2841571 RepID=UPI001C0A4320|nr:NmrA family NAD(P)-binding protein [Aestuariibacter sp. A3R04]MBU3023633.1 NmrA family NAD(P)-binding protein [Aestuariibacter sp. A3R04]
MKFNTNKYLVIGASGKTGSRVYQKLHDLGLDVQGASRNGEIHFDWQAPETWARALLGVDAVYLTYYPDLAMPQAPDDIAKFCALAKIKGVKHITLLSGRGEPAAQVCEEIVQTSDLSNTIVRASWFNQNFSEGMFHNFIVAGTIELPVGAVGEPFVDVDDICDVVVASLLDERHNGKLYEVTGPELLSFAQLADIFSKVLQTPISFVEVSLSDFVATLRDQKVDSHVIDMLTYLFTEVLDGRNAYAVDGVEQALGRSAKTFEQFVIANQNHFGRGSHV